MTSEPEPCPWCPDGGEPRHFGGAGLHCVRCAICGRTNEKLVFDDRRGWHYVPFESARDALDDWNTRPGRTCHRVDSRKTFGITDGGHPFDCCSLCARKLYVEDEYCSGCGAKVVE